MSKQTQKFCNIAAITGAAIVVHSGFFGNKNHIRLNEDDAQKLDDALASNDNTALQEQISSLQAEKATLINEKNALQASNETTQNALEQALELNGLDACDSIEESITLLGTTCNTYGKNTQRHTFSPINGEETDPSGDGMIEGYIDPKDEHNQLINNFNK